MRRSPSPRFPAQTPSCGDWECQWASGRLRDTPPSVGGPLKISRAEPGSEGQVERFTRRQRARLMQRQ